MQPTIEFNTLTLTNPDWACLLQEAFSVAAISEDPSTQVGAAILTPAEAGDNRRPTGFNRRVSKMGYERLPEQERRYRTTIHAEEDALQDLSTSRSNADRVMACTLACCPHCALLMVHNCIDTLIVHHPTIVEYIHRCGGKDPWHIFEAHEFLHLSGVNVLYVGGPIPGAQPILLKGQEWQP